ncbi:uncharacterized protein LOC105701736 isoform X2 [Orussus abietinus]|uniref:uncharacterized protein LOC105701736 isoform X2 n=1 Tax=Orussus abietinus TaxID=222816 RepID=UPI00062647FF|nr:uncharacterized protein LOC105701736 isoform X2 [Orussus abietinus]
MRTLWWICWLLWESLPALTAYPISGPLLTDSNNGSSWPWHWEHYWLRFTVGLLGVTATALTLVGCLCCKRNRRPKGFEEFKDGSSTVQDLTFENALRGLELEVPRLRAPNDPVHFEPLPVDELVAASKAVAKPKPPSNSPFGEDRNQDDTSSVYDPCREWFDASHLHVPRERLKYLREIGRGWFGRVVEGRADLEEGSKITGNGGVVVRILGEDASTKEKSWFLGEATSYLRLRHGNLLTLVGACVETDPYLLLFESCPLGDLKGFLRSNRDPRSREALLVEDVPRRMALGIAAGLQHMHDHGFSHTDLSARNCLVSSDLSAKLGDYGTGVEKYPLDYYVVGDRALPIRWSAPESLECTETTIETREITPRANLWSFAVLLWELSSWGERPYDALGDERVIEELLSLKCGSTGGEPPSLGAATEEPQPAEFAEAIVLCRHLDPDCRRGLDEVRAVLGSRRSVDPEDFERRWEVLRPNASSYFSSGVERARSASLQDLRVVLDEAEILPRASFRLGPEEPVRNVPGSGVPAPATESGSETEEESWRGRVERGAYTEKVEQKSKSVTDLMVLVHIDSDSDADRSLNPPGTERPPPRRKAPSSGSDGDLRGTVLADEFDAALRRLRDPLPGSRARESPEETPGAAEVFGTLLASQECTPILRLSLEPSRKEPDLGVPRGEGHVLRLLDSGDPGPLLRYAPESSAPGDHAGEKRAPLPEEDVDEATASTPDTPRSRRNVDDDEPSNAEDLELEGKKPSTDCEEEEEEDRKHPSTPDDERSSDSGFRDKESCEEEENPPVKESVCTEEEQLRILFELDTILDAEYRATPSELGRALDESSSPEGLDERIESGTGNGNSEHAIEKDGVKVLEETSPDHVNDVFEEKDPPRPKDASLANGAQEDPSFQDLGEYPFPMRGDEEEDEDEDEEEDSSTVSPRSDNSCVSLGTEEDFVAAIRNELREKLPRAQMSVVEAQEPRREDEEPVISSLSDTRRWEEDEEGEDASAIDIAIEYNAYGTPLSPILEERESAVNSESLISKEDSRDVSVASVTSAPTEDLLLVDTRTNGAVLVEGRGESHGDRDTSDEENLDSGSNDLISPRRFQGTEEPLRRGGGAPLPSPEDELKWQQVTSSFPLPAPLPTPMPTSLPAPLPMQEDLVSTSFSSEQDWDSQDEEEDEDEEEEDDDDEENSSSSGEFVWKRYDEADLETRMLPGNFTGTTGSPGILEGKEHVEARNEEEEEGREGEQEDDEEEEEEFTPSTWDATLAPHRSALRSPDKTQKSGDQKKSVWFKKQLYHCVYEYPKESLATENPVQSTTAWEPTSYADWEVMMDEPKLDLYPLDYDDTDHSGDAEFYVSSSSRPFQFQSGDEKYVSQFFPGAGGAKPDWPQQGDAKVEDMEAKQREEKEQRQHQRQLGELRHTRDRLKLNLSSVNGNSSGISNATKQAEESKEIDLDPVIEKGTKEASMPSSEKEIPGSVESSSKEESTSEEGVLRVAESSPEKILRDSEPSLEKIEEIPKLSTVTRVPEDSGISKDDLVKNASPEASNKTQDVPKSAPGKRSLKNCESVDNRLQSLDPEEDFELESKRAKRELKTNESILSVPPKEQLPSSDS